MGTLNEASESKEEMSRKKYVSAADMIKQEAEEEAKAAAALLAATDEAQRKGKLGGFDWGAGSKKQVEPFEELESKKNGHLSEVMGGQKNEPSTKAEVIEQESNLAVDPEKASSVVEANGVLLPVEPKTQEGVQEAHSVAEVEKVSTPGGIKTTEPKSQEKSPPRKIPLESSDSSSSSDSTDSD